MDDRLVRPVIGKLGIRNHAFLFPNSNVLIAPRRATRARRYALPSSTTSASITSPFGWLPLPADVPPLEAPASGPAPGPPPAACCLYSDSAALCCAWVS